MSGVFKMLGQATEKRGIAAVGETVALGKLDGAKTGETISAGKKPHASLADVKSYPPVLAIAISAKERKDDVKLGQALNKLIDEDPSLIVVHNPETHEVVVWGQGEMHLRVVTERLADRYGVAIERRPPSIGYRETIRKPVVQRGRHKKQSGGHGQFGDVVLDIRPMPRSSGFTFADEIKGGVVPNNYISSVEEGIIDALKHGPLGFPVVDVAVKLIDGSYHAVNSSDMAFRTAARIGIVEGLPQCSPVLLEPIHTVEIVCPTDATAKINAILSGRRGQILGFDTREGWQGWDVVRAMMPEVGDRRPHHRGALGDGRRRRLHLQVRPHGGIDGQARRSDRRGEKGRIGGGIKSTAAPATGRCCLLRLRERRVARAKGDRSACARSWPSWRYRAATEP